MVGPNGVSAFTAEYNAQSGGRVSELLTPCWVLETTNQSPTSGNFEFQAVWDTGAQLSAISPKVVRECSLQPSGMRNLRYADGRKSTEPTYLVNLLLPNGVGVRDLEVNLGDPGSDRGLDVLIGMDVIGIGDFAVSNYNNKTVMSFRFPSQGHIDFVKESPPPSQQDLMAQVHRARGSTRPKKKSARRR